MDVNLQLIQRKIYEIRGQRVMFDFDLAALYQVETKRLKEQVRRNIERFPPDFMMKLSTNEWKELVAICDQLPEAVKHTSAPPFVFTQEGIAMLSGVLRSPLAIQVNISIMRAFVVMRQYLISNTPAKELEELQKQVKYLQEDVESLNKDQEGYEKQFDEIYLAIAELSVRNKTLRPRKPIGFVQEENQDS